MSGYYPYLMCGLPELRFGMDLEDFSYAEIESRIEESLVPSDRKKLRLFLAFPGHAGQVERYLAFEDEDSRLAYMDSDPDLPAYQRLFFASSPARLLAGEEDGLPEMRKEELVPLLKAWLDRAFYAQAQKSRNAFIRKWFDFDLVLRNTLVAYVARLQARSPEKEFVFPSSQGKPSWGSPVQGEPEIITWIKENMQQGDFGLKLRLSYAEELFSALDSPDVYERERNVDFFRWRMAEEMVLDKDFQIDAVLAYVLKANILSRWKAMDREKGLALLRETVDRMRRVPLQEVSR